MKKWLTILGALAAIAALVSIGAFGVFSDTETAEDNTFVAGTLDLKVDDVDDPSVKVVVSDVEPLWSDYYYWTLKNAGTVSGQPSIEFSPIDNYDNNCNEPEAELDTTCGDPGLGEGELGGKLYVQLHWSNDGGTTWNALRCNADWGNHLLNTCGSKTTGLGAFSGSGPGIDTALPVLNAGDEIQFRFHPWWHNTATDNIAQSDSVEFDIVFHLDQVQ